MKLQFFSLVATTFALAPLLISAPQPRITHAVDPSRTVKLSSSLRVEATPQNDRGAVDSDLLIDGVTLVLPPSPEQQAALDTFLEAQRDPSSPDYHRWLTPELFADRFGADENDVNAIAGWLRAEGLNVDQIARGRNYIVVSGTAAQFSLAFKTTIHKFQSGGKLRYANSVAPSIPEAFSSVVTEVRGLDDFRPEPMHLKVANISPDYTSTSSGAHYLAPDDWATIYDVTGLYQAGFDGTGQKIAVVGQTDINLADIQAFRTRFNLPANTPQVVLTGRDPGTSTSDMGEADLDLEWVGAIARNATLIYVNSRNVFTSVQYAINQNLAPVISMSYGGCEQQNSSSIRSLAQQANAQGITWIASSGDQGAAGCESSTAAVATQGLAVNIPASIPEVTGIGGTTFVEGAGSFWAAMNSANGASALSYIPETAWNDSATRSELSASGGGVSTFYTKPSWQSGTGVPNDGMRDVPDLAFSASPDHDGYLFYTAGALGAVGGTSAPAPAFAGVLGLLNQYLLKNGALQAAGLGNINPSLYHLAQSAPSIFHDVTSGNNVVPCTTGTKSCTTGSFGYNAGIGYDLVTGLGSADVYKLVTNWTNIVASVGTVSSLSASPASFAQNTTTQLTAVVRPASGSTIPTGTVSFSSGTANLGTATLAASGTGASASIGVAGTSLALGNDTLVATYTGNTNFAGSSASATVNVTAPATGNSNVVPTVNPNPVTEVNNSWSFTIVLTETAGQATTLTNFTVNGTSYASQIARYFGTTKIPAKGVISSSLRTTGLTPPTNLVFGFSGVDPSGRQWTQSITVPFNGPANGSISTGN